MRDLPNLVSETNNIYIWFQLGLDFIQLIFVAVTATYLVYKRVKIGEKTLSNIIWLQVVLVVTQTLLFNIGAFYQIIHDVKHFGRETVPFLIYHSFTVAALIFWAQHWIYVSEYMKISIVAPLTFCIQSPKVKQKRQNFRIFYFVLNVVAYTSLAVDLLLTLILELDLIYQDIFWNLSSFY